MYSNFRRVCIIKYCKIVPKPLCVTVVNAAGFCETSEPIKWHEKILMKENRCTELWGMEFFYALMLSDQLICLSHLSPSTTHTAEQCASLLSAVLHLHCPRPTTLADIDSVTFSSVALSKSSKEAFPQGLGDIRTENRSSWLYCARATHQIPGNRGPDVFSEHFWWGYVCDWSTL